MESRYCPNCHYPLADFGEFCSNCGQKYTTGRVTLRHLAADFFESILSLDSRIFLTLRDLFVPGKLTTEYFLGRHRRYLSPLRLFLVMAVIHFAVLSFYGVNFFSDIDARQQRLRSEEGAFYDYFLSRLDSAAQEVTLEMDSARTAVAAMQRLREKLPATSPQTVERLINIDRDSLRQGHLNFSPVKMSQTDYYRLSPDSLLNKYQIDWWLPRLIDRQIIKLVEDPDNFSKFLLGQFTWMVLLMMPALALLLRLLYIRRGQYYVEHLIFSFHYHAFAFLIMSAALLVESDKTEGMFPSLALFLILVYLFVAMRRVYRQGVIKTFVKFSILNFSYIFIFVVFLLLTFAVSALVY